MGPRVMFLRNIRKVDVLSKGEFVEFEDFPYSVICTP